MSVRPLNDDGAMSLADDKVDEWHTGNARQPIWVHMRLTHDEYKTFVETSRLPDDYLDRFPEGM